MLDCNMLDFAVSDCSVYQMSDNWRSTTKT